MSNLSVLRVKTVEETLNFLADPDVNSKVLSGGVSITLQLRNGNLNCDRLIDVSQVDELKSIQSVTLNGEFVDGAIAPQPAGTINEVLVVMG